MTLASFDSASNPVLALARRGDIVESFHRGAISIIDADGAEIVSLGDIDRPVFPRSSIKALQALPLVESGAADKFGFDDAKLALACSSHGGERGHYVLAQEMLASTGCSCEALACGAHWPMNEKAAHQLAREGRQPTRLHNACSGKHIGFICLAQTLGIDPQGYQRIDHRVQREVKDAIEALGEVRLSDEAAAIDGCSVPTWAMPLRTLALAFAKLGSGARLDVKRSRAARRLTEACMREPWYVGGTDRFCTEMLRLLQGKAFLKFGAEGVFCAAIPDEGVGIAIKCDDGANRAAQVLVAAAIRRTLNADVVRSPEFERLLSPAIQDWNGKDVGAVELAVPID